MILDRPVEEEGLGDEEVGTPGGVEERVGPLGVAGVGHDLAVTRDPERERRRAAGVHDLVRGDRARAKVPRRPLDPLDEARIEPPRDARGPREEHLQRVVHARLDAGRPRHREGPGAPLELAVEDQERDAREVVAVQVGEEHGVHALRVHAETPHRDQRGRAAVHEEAPARGLDVDARLEPPAAAERVAGAEEPDLHPDLLRGPMISCLP